LFVDDDFAWDDERDHKRHKRGPGSYHPSLSRENMLNKYKIMQIQMQDRNGNYVIVKRRIA